MRWTLHNYLSNVHLHTFRSKIWPILYSVRFQRSHYVWDILNYQAVCSVKIPFVFTHAVISTKVYPFEGVIILGITVLFLAYYFCFNVNYRESIMHFFLPKSVVSATLTWIQNYWQREGGGEGEKGMACLKNKIK